VAKSNTTPSTTVVVNFGGAASDTLSAEVDDRATGLNGGQTSFDPGDTVYYLLYHSPTVRVSTITASAGSVQRVSPGVVVKEVDVQFENKATAALSVPATGIVSVTWLGRSLGALTLSEDGVTLRAQTAGVAVARLKVNTQPVAFGLASPVTLGGYTDFPILVMVTGELVS